MPQFLTDLLRRQPLVTITALIHLALAALMLIGLAVDQRTILGLNPWIKPLKFAVSIAIYLGTMALFLSNLQPTDRLPKAVAIIISITMLIEISLISMQALRGTTSHFNTSTSFDGIVFGVMGTAIGINSLAVLIVLWQYVVASPPLSASYLWGIRLGIGTFLLASLQGFLMASRTAHSVGGVDGGPGLPLVNWSINHGDLRVAHFVGLHGLQIVPLVGYLAGGSYSSERGSVMPSVLVFGTAGLVLGVMLWAWVQALSGKPLVAGR